MKLQFKADLGGSPVAIDHYLIYRSFNPALGGWINVSGPLVKGEWIDPNPIPGPVYYRVVPVTVDNFGQPYEGFPGPTLRVEPSASLFRNQRG